MIAQTRPAELKGYGSFVVSPVVDSTPASHSERRPSPPVRPRSPPPGLPPHPRPALPRSQRPTRHPAAAQAPTPPGSRPQRNRRLLPRPLPPPPSPAARTAARLAPEAVTRLQVHGGQCHGMRQRQYLSDIPAQPFELPVQPVDIPPQNGHPVSPAHCRHLDHASSCHHAPHPNTAGQKPRREGTAAHSGNGGDLRNPYPLGCQRSVDLQGTRPGKRPSGLFPVPPREKSDQGVCLTPPGFPTGVSGRVFDKPLPS